MEIRVRPDGFGREYKSTPRRTTLTWSRQRTVKQSDDLFSSYFFVVVGSDEVETLARELHCRLYRTSVKEDLNVSQVFNYLAEKYISQLDALDDYCDTPPRSITIGQ